MGILKITVMVSFKKLNGPYIDRINTIHIRKINIIGLKFKSGIHVLTDMILISKINCGSIQICVHLWFPWIEGGGGGAGTPLILTEKYIKIYLNNGAETFIV